MTIKLTIKLGTNELHYEGSEDFLATQLHPVIENFARFGTTNHQNLVPNKSNIETDSGNSNGAISSSIQMTVANIALKLNDKTGAGLALAASLYLALVVGKAEFNRKEILDAMKSATGHYKETQNKNLSSSLKKLVKDGILNEITVGKYSLSAAKRFQYESQLTN